MKTKTWINLIVVLMLLYTSFGIMPYKLPAAQAATIIHVKPGGGTSAGCGYTWVTACDLQTALTTDWLEEVEIWVKKGTYKPGPSREDKFHIFRQEMALYGGFTGKETSRGQRDWKANLTVLSGDIGVPGDSSDNSYHVVRLVESPATLDGFTITGGNADGGGWDSVGGGMYMQDSYYVTLANLIFRGNQALNDGGGLYNYLGSTTLTNVISNVIFSNNSAGNRGGGMYNWDNSTTLINVTFRGNTAGESGGGIYNYGSEAPMTNVTFSGNEAEFGGGMYNDSGSIPVLTNVTFSGNTAGQSGGGIYNLHGFPLITNSILWGNTAGSSGPQIYNYGTSESSILYSDVQGGCAANPGNHCPGGGNIDTDPLFGRDPHPGADGTWGTADDDYGDLRLIYWSPAIDAGDNTAPGLAGITTDLDGNPRFYDVPGIADTGVGPPPVVDMGAYEAIILEPLWIYLPTIVR